MAATESILAIYGVIKSALSEIDYVQIVFPPIRICFCLASSNLLPESLEHCDAAAIIGNQLLSRQGQADFRCETQRVRIGPASRGSAVRGGIAVGLF
jgi:hypothetical protein